MKRWLSKMLHPYLYKTPWKWSRTENNWSGHESWMKTMPSEEQTRQLNNGNDAEIKGPSKISTFVTQTEKGFRLWTDQGFGNRRFISLSSYALVCHCWSLVITIKSAIKDTCRMFIIFRRKSHILSRYFWYFMLLRVRTSHTGNIISDVLFIEAIKMNKREIVLCYRKKM